MKIRMLTSMSGGGVVYEHGQVIDVSPDIGMRWITHRVAEAVEEPGVTANIVRAPETAMRKRPKERRNR